MAPTTVWPVVGSLGAAGGTLALIWYLRDRRERPGANWLLAVLGVQFLLTAGYGVGYLLFDPVVRWWIEVLFWVAYIWLGALFVAFGLAYTGRGHVIRSPWFGVLALLSLSLTALVVTNPLHHLVWEGFRVDPALGLSAVRFERRGGALLILGVASLGASVGTLLLVDTILSYGKLYRREALAVAVSPLPPGIGFVLWTFDVGPAPGVNVAPVLFVLHVILDAYAFVGSGMFEFHPATRRAGNRAAIADLRNPVVVVDEQRRVVNVNPAAEEVFDLSVPDVLSRPFPDCYEGDPVDPTVVQQDVEMGTTAGLRTFKVTATPLYDGTDTHLGYTLVFQDITDERQREQRLAVLNRVLRHNLRNDLTVVQMRLDRVRERVDEKTAADLDAIDAKTDGLVDLSQKARTFERVTDDAEEIVAVTELVEAVVDDWRETYPDATVAVRGDDDATLHTKRGMLRVVVSNLVENALEHGRPATDGDHGGETAVTDGQPPDVIVTVTAEADAVVLGVRDHGPGIPEHELSVIAGGDESALEHGSGLGLWLVNWGVRAVGGELAFDTGNGTTVTVRIPVVADSG